MVKNVGDKLVRRTRASLVLVDDEEGMCRALGKYLTTEDYEVAAFSDPAAAIEAIRSKPPDVVITDMMMPGLTGMDVLRAARQASEETSVIVMTGYGSIEGAIGAMKEGAFDYVTKPLNMAALLEVIAKACRHNRLVQENEALGETLNKSGEHEFVGESPAVREVLATVAKVAPTDAPVLIWGESGTGKELIARAVHNGSPRRKKRFVAINCASIPENLIESELFGYEKGAFTGADRTKMGLMELAHDGTLFLDEIGELPVGLQTKLLRVLQEHEIQRVGAVRTTPVDFRLVAATNRNLQEAIERKEFREDLFYRIGVITVDLPPLRERTGDIKLLVDHFLIRARRTLKRPNLMVSPEALTALENYRYPGNVRELQNVLERMFVLSDQDMLTLEDVPADIRTAAVGEGGAPSSATPGAAVDYREAKDRFERDYLVRLISEAGGNISEAARMSGISRRHLYEKIEKLGIRTDR